MPGRVPCRAALGSGSCLLSLRDPAPWEQPHGGRRRRGGSCRRWAGQGCAKFPAVVAVTLVPPRRCTAWQRVWHRFGRAMGTLVGGSIPAGWDSGTDMEPAAAPPCAGTLAAAMHEGCTGGCCTASPRHTQGRGMAGGGLAAPSASEITPGLSPCPLLCGGDGAREGSGRRPPAGGCHRRHQRRERCRDAQRGGAE